MRIAISNIAWDTAEDEAVASLLCRYGIDAVDIAPAKYFPVPAEAREEEIQRVRSWWSDRGIQITGMQALLFGTSGLNVFGSSEVQAAMLKHLSAVCRIGAGLGAKRLVFGSPKNRDRTGLTDRKCMEMAIAFFRRLGDIAQSFNVEICLEPNPACYGANFMTDSVETGQVVESVAHPAIRMQLDTGAMTINKEDPDIVLQAYAPLIGHVHASEPELLPLGDGGTDHRGIGKALSRYLPEHVVSIEMLATAEELHAISIERSLCKAIEHYGNSGTSTKL